MLSIIVSGFALMVAALSPAQDDSARFEQIRSEVGALGLGSEANRAQIDALIAEAQQIDPVRGQLLELIERSRRNLDEAEAADLRADALEACQSGSVQFACEIYAGLLSRAFPNDPVQQAEVLRVSEEACDTGFAMSCRRAAGYYHRGEFVEQDRLKAATLAERSCQGGDAQGCRAQVVSLRAELPLHGPTLQRTGPVLEQGCELGDAMSCRLRAGDYEQGWGVTADPERMAYWHQRACELGLQASCE